MEPGKIFRESHARNKILTIKAKNWDDLHNSTIVLDKSYTGLFDFRLLSWKFVPGNVHKYLCSQILLYISMKRVKYLLSRTCKG